MNTHTCQESSRELAVTRVKADTLLCAAGCVCGLEFLIKFSSLTGRNWPLSNCEIQGRRHRTAAVSHIQFHVSSFVLDTIVHGHGVRLVTA